MVCLNDIVAVGGDLTPERILHAYANGIFPWYAEGDPVLWWSPNPRLVLFPNELHISRKMKRFLRNFPFDVSIDMNFPQVIENCRQLRKEIPGTWITPEIKNVFSQLHLMGFVHSLEIWQGERLVGGLYGLSLGKFFFGESMFHTVADSSKFAFIKLAQKLREWGFLVIDCQVPSPFLRSFGAREISRDNFLKILKEGLKFKSHLGPWDFSRPGPLDWITL